MYYHGLRETTLFLTITSDNVVGATYKNLVASRSKLGDMEIKEFDDGLYQVDNTAAVGNGDAAGVAAKDLLIFKFTSPNIDNRADAILVINRVNNDRTETNVYAETFEVGKNEDRYFYVQVTSDITAGDHYVVNNPSPDTEVDMQTEGLTNGVYSYYVRCNGQNIISRTFTINNHAALD